MTEPDTTLSPTFMTDMKWFTGMAIYEKDGLRKARNRLLRYFPKKSMGPWWNWYIDRKRVPLPTNENERIAEQYIRRNSWRRTL